MKRSYIARRFQSSGAGLSLDTEALAKYKDIIDLSIGDTDFTTDESIINAAFRDAKAGHTHYGDPKGDPELIDAVCRAWEEDFGQRLPRDHVLVSASSCLGMALVMLAILDPGDEVIVFSPYFPMYREQIELAGGVCVDVPTYASEDYAIDEARLRAAITPRTKLLILPYPNNPTGTTLTKEELKKWVNYALANDCLIMYDSAYEAYIQDPNIPHSIYEIKGAKKVAIEFRSFSKTAGFTGVRCGYTIVPKELNAFTLAGERVPLNRMWNRRQCTKFNGTSYITQRGAEAVYSPEGKEQVRKTIDYYMANARIMRESLQSCGLRVYGGENAPYIWLKTPDGLSSWKFFDKLLYEVNIVGTPGVGFGPGGEGFLRLTAFGDRDDTLEAMSRLKKWLL